MPIRPILTAPDPALRRSCYPVPECRAVTGLAQDLLDTALSVRGLGLSAPQLGVTRRVFVLTKAAGTEGVYVNPEILRLKGGVTTAEEGCLSLPGKTYRVRRHRRVRLSWQDLDGERHEAWFAHLQARVIQYEVDHLDGLIIDEIGVAAR